MRQGIYYLVALLLTGSWLLLSKSGSLAGSVQAPSRSTDISIDLRDAALSELLNKLSSQLKKPVLFDGDSGRKVSLGLHGPASSVLPTLSRILDVDVREGKHGAVLLVPRFSNGPGPPQADAAEIAQLARNALKTIPDAKPDPDHQVWGGEIRRLATTLAPPQVEALRNGKPLPWAELTPDQKTLLANCLNARLYGGPRFFWSAVLAATAEPDQSTLLIDDRTNTLIMRTPDRYQVGPIRLGTAPRTGGVQ